jgi:plasmid maintenance system killer protein
MIKNFRAKETEKIWHGEHSRRMPQDIQQIARRKLRMINNAQSLMIFEYRLLIAWRRFVEIVDYH